MTRSLDDPLVGKVGSLPDRTTRSFASYHIFEMGDREPPSRLNAARQMHRRQDFPRQMQTSIQAGC